MKCVPLFSLLIGAALLAGCNESAGPIAAAPSARPIAQAQFASPGGNSACGAELSRFQGVLKADLDSGNVNQSVYDQIERELSGAARACEAGHDGESIGIIRAAKARHGYRAGA